MVREFEKPDIVRFRTLSNVLVQRYERYLPTAFDESMSMLEKVNKIIEFLETVVRHLNDQSEALEDWQEKLIENLGLTLDSYVEELERIKQEYEDFRQEILDDILPDSVKNKLEEWLLDGTLADLINDLLFTDLNERIERIEKQNKGLEVNVFEFGATGDGVTDDRQAVLDAIAEVGDKGGGVVKFPSGTFMLSGEYVVPSNVHIKGEGRGTIIKHKARGVLFRTDGTYSDRVSFTQNSLLGDNYATVSDTRPYKVGDYIRIMSQRPATDNTQDTEFQLGHATAESHRVYFGEIRKISAITGNQLFFRGGLMYPTYMANNTEEIHPNARRNATVDKVNYVDSPQFSDLTFQGNVGTPIRLSVTKFAKVSNCYWLDAEDGDFISFHQCYMSEGYKSVLMYNPGVADGGTYSRNGLKTVSSWNSGFDGCEVHNGTQSVDFTYSTSGETIPNVGSYFKNGKTVGAVFNSSTAHGGTDLTQVTNNIMLACHRNGIGVRSRNAIIVNNTVVGGANLIEADSTMGISIEQAGAVNNIVQGNVIKQFLIGIRLHDVLDSRIEKVNLMIKDNNISLVNRAIQLRRNAGSTFNGSAYVFIEGNIMHGFIGEFGKAVDIYDHINNVTFKNNSIQGNASINGGFYSRGDSHNFTVTGNKFVNAGRHIWLSNVDPEITSQPTIWMFDNTFSPVFEGNSDLGNFRRLTPYLYGSLQPINDSVYNLGYSDRKFDRVFLAQQPIVASDRRLKENIEPLTKGLDFIKNIKPVSYNMKDSDAKHYGVVAQDLIDLVGDEDALVEYFKDGDIYMVRYDEFIPVLIKAIQELNNKIK